MKIILTVLLLCLVLYVTYAVARFYSKYQTSKALIEAARPFKVMGDRGGVTLLVLGDSTAVGVGADTPEDTVAARLAHSMKATYVENHARSGAHIADLPKQIAQAELPRYSAILVQIGGNDIIRFHDAGRVTDVLEDILQTLPPADQIYLMTAGNVGAATLFPWPITYFHTRLNLRYHEALAAIAKRLGIRYVNLYEDPQQDPFMKEPQRYLSGDGLHPSSSGYDLWFKKLLLVMQEGK